MTCRSIVRLPYVERSPDRDICQIAWRTEHSWVSTSLHTWMVVSCSVGAALWLRTLNSHRRCDHHCIRSRIVCVSICTLFYRCHPFHRECLRQIHAWPSRTIVVAQLTPDRQIIDEHLIPIMILNRIAESVVRFRWDCDLADFGFLRIAWSIQDA